MRTRLLASLLLLGSATAAHASAWYVVGAISQSTADLDRTALDSTLTNNGATALSSHQSGTHDQWRLQLGYRLNPYLALEAGYIDLGSAKYSATFSGGSTTVDWKSGGVDLAAGGTLPIGDQLSLLGKVGLIDAKTTGDWHDSGIAGLPAGGVNKTALHSFIGLGAAYALTLRTSLRGEYEYFNGIGDSHTTGSANVNVLSIGISYRF